MSIKLQGERVVLRDVMETDQVAMGQKHFECGSIIYSTM
ncbi:putative RNA-binding protein [Paenibacillus sp. DS2015]